MTSIDLQLTTLKRFRTAIAHLTILLLGYTKLNLSSPISKVNDNDKPL
ncbi:MAG: hypothetical protein V7K47_10575 [Nostoc sp.]